MNMSAVLQISAAVTGAQAVDQLKEKISGLHGAAHHVSEGFSTLAEGIKSFTEIAIVDKILELGKHVLETGEQMDIMSKRTGVAVEELGKFSGAARLNGASIEDVATGMKKLSTHIVEAANGNREFTKIFSALGISVRDGNGQIKNAGQVMMEVADAFTKFDDGATKSAVAVKLLGKAGDSLIPMLDEGSHHISALGENVSTEFAKNAHEFNDNIQKMKMNLEDLARFSFAPLISGFNSVVEEMKKSNEYFKEHGKTELDQLNQDYMANITINKQKEELSGIKNQLKEDILELKNLDEYILNLTEGYIKDKYISERENLIKAMADLLETGKALDLQIKNSMQMGALGRGFGGGSVESVNVPNQSATRRVRDLTKQQMENNVANAVGSPAGSMDTLKEFLVTQRTAIDQLKLEGQAATMTASEYAQLKAAKEFEGQLDKLKISQAGKISQSFLNEAEALKKAKMEAIAYNEEFKHTFAGGIQEGLKAVAEQANDVGGAIKSAMTDAFKGAEDAFVSFVQTGKVDFKSLMDSVIADLARAQFRSMMSGIFGGSSGGFNITSLFGTGGGTNLPAAPPMYAMGTDSAAGGLSIVGENGPELVNLPRGASVTPNNKLNQAGGQTVIVNQTFTANANARELASIAGQIKNETIAAVYGSFGRGTLSARA